MGTSKTKYSGEDITSCDSEGEKNIIRKSAKLIVLPTSLELVTVIKMHYGKYIPLVVSALTVLLLGMANPRLLQKRSNGTPTGEVDPKWLALAGLGAGVGSCLLLDATKQKKGF